MTPDPSGVGVDEGIFFAVGRCLLAAPQNVLQVRQVALECSHEPVHHHSPRAAQMPGEKS
jgi:hypothetical protein